jgi:predicted amidohydrolase YtcJ
LVLAAGAGCRHQPTEATASATADAVYTGGDILTMAGDTPRYAEALAVKDGKILAVGSKAEVMARAGAGTKQLDLAGKTLLPGFIDAHGHFIYFGKNALDANLKPATSVADVVARMKAHAANVPPGDWIVGLGYRVQSLAEQRPPTADELDQVSTIQPVMAINGSVHGGAVNHYALEMMGWDSKTKDPAGGTIVRRPGSREPLGPLDEQAMNQVRDRRPALSEADMDKALKLATEAWASGGQTTAMECGVGLGADDIEVVRHAIDHQSIPVDLVVFAKDSATDDVINASYGVAEKYNAHPEGTANALRAIRPDLDKRYVNRVRLGGIKFWLDGEPFTAWMSQPFASAPPGMKVPKDYKGYGQVKDEVINAAFDRFWTTPMQINLHANGDQAVEQALQAIEAAVKKHGMSDHRPVFVHSSYIRPDQFKRIKAVGGIPTFLAMSYHDLAADLAPIWGLDRAHHAMAAQTAIREGLPISLHHDAPIQPPVVLPNLWAAVTRLSTEGKVYGPDERLTPYQALQAVTANAAHQIKEEKSKGTLEAGKLADLVILDRNPLKVDPMAIKEIRVLETVKEGKTIYHVDASDRRVGFTDPDFGTAPHAHDEESARARNLSAREAGTLKQLFSAAEAGAN